ncbi:thiamine pyrophosphate-dependent dehydrogenase E1 component subunit alpha [Robinsoniella sp. KNHs210]|uniref:thiamine pyrophosphate-dependent dehydrogenase E1 component subunit alpha n=1 Tax=Robinsoniella sp. KNHs210 TaxID=1469950 RepID=UPI001FA6CCEE|nr:thiamine pyrophosphate-dependent dehydrogenase E1 component subunit alpha [Robinsoniella sp. KNHs210]
MMYRIRAFEMKAVSLFEENKLRGSVHLCVGEEAGPAAMANFISDSDYITSTHRGHGHCIAKGARLDKALCELMGKEDGYCHGRSGSMHIADFEKGNLGANAIVGGGYPIATGAALGIKMQNKNNVVVCWSGDAATNEGTFHEALNLASVWKLPVLFVVENNLYGISVPQWQSTSVKDISVRAKAYDMPGETVDGNDVVALAEVFERAVEYVRGGNGPILIETKTYRWLGHWTGDPTPYRTKEELKEWKQKCPIKRLRAHLASQFECEDEELDALEKSAAKEMEKAAEIALAASEPDPVFVMRDVFYEGGVE